MRKHLTCYSPCNATPMRADNSNLSQNSDGQHRPFHSKPSWKHPLPLVASMYIFIWRAWGEDLGMYGRLSCIMFKWLNTCRLQHPLGKSLASLLFLRLDFVGCFSIVLLQYFVYTSLFSSYSQEPTLTEGFMFHHMTCHDTCRLFDRFLRKTGHHTLTDDHTLPDFRIILNTRKHVATNFYLIIDSFF